MLIISELDHNLSELSADPDFSRVLVIEWLLFENSASRSLMIRSTSVNEEFRWCPFFHRTV